MRLLIVGASGRTGRLLTQRALERGHDVTAFVRDPSHLPAADGPLRVVVGDALSPEAVMEAARGQDAIISLLAPRPRTNGRVYIEGTRNLANAAAQTGARRIIAVSAEGAGVGPEQLTLAYRLILHIPVVARLYPDIARMETELRARTDVDWTVVRPAVLTNGPRTGRWRTVVGQVVPGGLRLSRADLAEFLLEVAEQDLYRRESVAVAY